MYTCIVDTPLGQMRAAAADKFLRGLWFIGQKYFPSETETWLDAPDHPVFVSLKTWLEDYFAGKNPKVRIPLSPEGTDFQQAVWKLLLEIPYGKTTTYGGIAARLATGGEPRSIRTSAAGSGQSGRTSGRAAAQAVGGAVGHNPISLIIPCHRVVGANGSLTGYAGGLEKKNALLELEGVTVFLPKIPRQPNLSISR